MLLSVLFCWTHGFLSQTPIFNQHFNFQETIGQSLQWSLLSVYDHLPGCSFYKTSQFDLVDRLRNIFVSLLVCLVRPVITSSFTNNLGICVRLFKNYDTSLWSLVLVQKKHFYSLLSGHLCVLSLLKVPKRLHCNWCQHIWWTPRWYRAP